MSVPFSQSGNEMTVYAGDPVDHVASVPGSKSLSNRYLLLAALAKGKTFLEGVLTSDDTRYMSEALSLLGVPILENGAAWTVSGRAHWQKPIEALFVGNAGTAMRFLSPALARMDSPATITGNERMQQRPIGDLVDGLRQLGASVVYEAEHGFPPLRVEGPIKPGIVQVRGDASSQYLSGLLMTLPLLEGDSRVEVIGSLVSRTYVEMTLACMNAMGVTVVPKDDYRYFEVPGNQNYQPSTIQIEPDASTASYWFALPVMVGGRVRLNGTFVNSQQGDLGFLDILAKMGVDIDRAPSGTTVTAKTLSGIDVDMNTMSDVAATLAVVATRALEPVTIRNVGNMRIKECDRIDCLQTAFDALGLKMESGPDWMRVYPGTPTKEALLDPRDDHRMAMVFALLGLAYGHVRLVDPSCVAKTYPSFWKDMAAAFVRDDKE